MGIIIGEAIEKGWKFRVLTLSFELAEQRADIIIHVAVLLPQAFNQAYGVDYGAVVTSTELASDFRVASHTAR
jgi:hypothetical protein